MTDAPVLIDFESRSRCDIDDGGRNYWRHESTEALCCGWHDTATGESGMWLPGSPWPHRGRLLGAHNMTGFDRFGCVALGWMTTADTWIDTSEYARTAGIPGALDALATRWLGVAKDKEGSKFTRALSRVSRHPEISAAEWRELTPAQKRDLGVLATLKPGAIERVTAYCASDVDVIARGWPLLESWRDLEPDVVRVDRAINDRGVYLDTDLCRALLACDEINSEREIDAVASELGWTATRVRETVRSPQQFCGATGAPNAQKETIDAMIASGNAAPLARARRALATIARGKLEAGLALVSPDSRLRDTHRYYGAHTGRWSNLGMQLHNLPRPPKYYRAWSDVEVEKWSDDDLCRLADAVKSGDHCATPEGINILLRACICAAPGKTLAVCDFSGIEARALAWAAHDEPALDVFARGLDPYKAMAADIFGVSYDAVDKNQRGVGKIGVLACGYQMGQDKLYDNYSDALDGVAPSLGKNGYDLAGEIVTAWRQSHRSSVRLWYRCGDAFLAAIGGRETAVSCFHFAPSDDGRDVVLWLPSGRPIVYPDARLDGDGDPAYLSGKGWRHIYGGKIVENAIQALCRDLLAAALVRADAAGLPVVMHVHDEPVVEIDECAGQDVYGVLLNDCILRLDDWAAGFPIGAAGFVGKQYRK